MVDKNFSSLGRTGAHDWILIRVSSIIIFFYIIYLISFVLFIDVINYETWHNFFSKNATKIFTIITLFFILIHAWIGIWQILTDYIKILTLRIILQYISIIILMVYLIYGTIIILRIS